MPDYKRHRHTKLCKVVMCQRLHVKVREFFGAGLKHIHASVMLQNVLAHFSKELS